MGITTEEPIVIGSFQFTFAYILPSKSFDG